MKQTNAADPTQVADAGKRQKNEELDSANRWRALLSTPDGQDVLWEIMSYCNVFGTPYDNSGSKLYHNVGKQDVGRMVMSKIVNADEGALIKMMSKQQSKEKR